MSLFAFAALVALGAGLLLARQMPFQFIGRLILKPLGLLRRTPAIGEGATVGPNAWAAVALAFRDQTDMEAALDGDFQHERDHINRHGRLFKWIAHRVGYIRVPEEFTDEMAEAYARRGDDFFTRSVPIRSNANTLYEDVEGAVIANYFHESDRGSLFLLNEYRKIINGNLRKLLALFSIAVGAYLGLALFSGAGGWFDVSTWLGVSGLFGLTDAAINLAGFCILTGLALLFVCMLWYGVEYDPFQRNNTREMSNFITRYMARLNNHYRTAVAGARSVTVGSERDPKELAEDARKWHLAILWMGMRVFFIESYVRNVRFQLSRNTSLYFAFVPFFFALLYLIALAYIAPMGVFGPDVWPGFLAGLFILLIGLTLLGRGGMNCLRELDPEEWISFHQLGLAEAVGGVVGKYAEDVGYWKNRVGGGI
ncbi:MAG: hypothetical protein AAFX09_06215 [Pseudomonadota bacterium]